MSLVVAKESLPQHIGKHLGYSQWFHIDQERINQFADVTEDHLYIHVDPQRAAKTPLGSTIAHGFLVLSLVPRLLEECWIVPDQIISVFNYGLNKVRCPNPVKVDSEVRAACMLNGVTEKQENHLLFTYGINIEIQGESKPAMVAESLGMFIVE